MPTTKTSKTTRGRSQDRTKVAGGQDYEVTYEAKKTGKTTSDIRNAVKKSGNSRTKLESGMTARTKK